MFVHNLDRPRGRLALKLFGIKRSTELLLACSELQTSFLRDFLRTDQHQVKFIWDHTDIAFFCPGPANVNKKRPLIVSVGLEQRDYQTLAAATGDMDVDVKISGFSEDAAVLRRTFPAEMPANMSRKFYEWLDLVQLYRDADVVVVSVLENKYAAGVPVTDGRNGLRSTRHRDIDIGAKKLSGRGSGQELRAPETQPGSARPSSKRWATVQRRRHGQKKVSNSPRSRHDIERYVAQIADNLRTLART